MKTVTIHNDQIEQGATFYRVVVLFDDAAQTQLTDLTDKTPRATLMDQEGTFVEAFGCAIVEVEWKGQQVTGIGYALPRDVTATLDPRRRYLMNLDLDYADGVTSDRKLEGELTVKRGQRLQP